MLDKSFHSLLKHKRIFLLPLLAILSFLIYSGIRGARVDGSPGQLIAEDDPHYVAIRSLKEQFALKESLIVAITRTDGAVITRRESFDYIASLTEALKQVDGVEKATSFVNLKFPYTERRPATRKEENLLAKRLASKRIFRGDLISANRKTAAIHLRLVAYGDGSSDTTEAVAGIQKVLESKRRTDHEVHLAGLPVLFKSLPEGFSTDGFIFLGVSVAVGSVLLLIFFGSLRVLVACMSVILANALSVVGIIALTGRALNVITVPLPALLITLSLAVVVHIVSAYYEQYGRHPSRREALLRTMRQIWLPCLMTSVTTAVGFCSLAVSAITPIVEYGLFAALGVVTAFLLSMTLLPILLDLLAIEPSRRQGKRGDRALTGLLGAVAAIQDRHRFAVLIVAGITVLAAVAGIARIRVESNVVTYLDPDSPAVKAERYVREHLSGSSYLVVVVTEVSEGSLLNGKTLQAIRDLEREIEADPEIDDLLGGCISAPDYIIDAERKIDDFLRGRVSAPDYKPVDLEKRSSDSLREIIDTLSAEIPGLVNKDRTAMTIRVRLKTASTLEVKKITDCLRVHLDGSLRNIGLQYEISGTPILYASVADSLVRGQYKSAGLALAAICIIMVLVVRSIRTGLLSMIPNVIPVGMTLGIMGWTGIALNTSTSMIAAIALGIAVDDTIHFLFRYRRERAAGADGREAARRTITTTGRAITITSLVLAFGTLSLTASSMAVVARFGVLLSVTMMSALLGDLFLLPVCLRVFRAGGGPAAAREPDRPSERP